jgi:hypothetical protein
MDQFEVARKVILVHTSKPIHVDPGSDLDRYLDDAAEAPVMLERDGQLYRLTLVERATDDDLWSSYDPERALAGIRAAAGGWQGLVDAEEFKRYIYERRRTANRPSVEL